MRNILFLAAFALAYFGLHAYVLSSLVRFFGVTSYGWRLAATGFTVTLALGFPIAAALTRSTLNPIVGYSYHLSAVWIGLLIFLVITITVAWLVHLTRNSFHLNYPMLPGTMAVLLAITLTVIGSVLALHPTVTDVKVNLKNLPANWSNRTVIQLSDVHLGKINGARYANKLVEQVNSLNPDAIFITGDLFDGMGSNPAAFIPILNGFKTNLGVYFVTGNHEHYLGLGKTLAALADSSIRVLDNERINIDGLQVIGLSFPGLDGQSYPADIITSMPGYDPAQPTVLLYHEPVNINHQPAKDTVKRSEMYFSPNTDYSVQRDSGVDLQLSGHTHAGQFFPFTVVAKRVFKGNHYGLHENGSFSIYTTSGVGTWGPPLRLGTRSEIVRLKMTPR